MHNHAVAEVGARLDDGERSDRDVAAEPGIRSTDGARMHADGTALVGPEHDERLREPRYGSVVRSIAHGAGASSS